MVESFLGANWEIDLIICTEERIPSRAALQGRNIEIDVVGQHVFSKLSDTETPQGIMAIVRIPRNEQVKIEAFDKILIADGISDPGNMGTIIRSARAFDFSTLITTSGSADLYSPKVVRASQGALAEIMALNHVDPEDIQRLLGRKFGIYALSAQGQTDIRQVKKKGGLALLVGSEAHGISPRMLALAKETVRIPISGKTESLNAAAAASIAMYSFLD